MSRLALGSVQFGMAYGVANQTGAIADAAVSEILTCARKNKITTIDTAIAYGESEQRLGYFGVSDFQVISKLPSVPVGCHDIFNWVSNSYAASLKRLKIKKSYGFLLHYPQDLFEKNGPKLYAAMLELKHSGCVEKIGVSIYDPKELDLLLANYDFDIVQAPFNIFDGRLIETGWLSRLAKKNIELHVRSVFLQGLLLMSKDDRPRKFNRWGQLWAEFDTWMDLHQLTALQACLGYAFSFPEISKIIIGVDSLNHLTQCLKSEIIDIPQPPSSLQCSDLNLLNPSNWNSL